MGVVVPFPHSRVDRGKTAPGRPAAILVLPVIKIEQYELCGSAEDIGRFFGMAGIPPASAPKI